MKKERRDVVKEEDEEVNAGVDVKLNQIDKLTRVKHHQIDFHPQHFFNSFCFLPHSLSPSSNRISRPL